MCYRRLQLPVHTGDKNIFCPPIQSFDNQTSKFTRPLENVLVPLYKNLKGGLAVHFYERKSKEQSIFDHV